jgi:hypothetical protein
MSNLKRNLIGIYDLVNNATLSKLITWKTARTNYALRSTRASQVKFSNQQFRDRNAVGLPLINPHMITYSNGAALVLVSLRCDLPATAKMTVQLPRR